MTKLIQLYSVTFFFRKKWLHVIGLKFNVCMYVCNFFLLWKVNEDRNRPMHILKLRNRYLLCGVSHPFRNKYNLSVNIQFLVDFSYLIFELNYPHDSLIFFFWLVWSLYIKDDQRIVSLSGNFMFPIIDKYTSLFCFISIAKITKIA